MRTKSMVPNYDVLSLAAIASVALLSCLGCGGSDLVTVSGTVTLDGQPLESGTIVFQAQGMAMCVGNLGAGGRYELSTGRQEGIAAGTYQVTITAFQVIDQANDDSAPIPKLLTPVKYNIPETSGLTAAVQRVSNSFDFVLTSD